MDYLSLRIIRIHAFLLYYLRIIFTILLLGGNLINQPRCQKLFAIIIIIIILMETNLSLRLRRLIRTLVQKSIIISIN